MLYFEDQEKHVTLPNGEKSQRKYATVSIQTTSQREYDYYSVPAFVTERSFYLDPLTGLVVFDVEKYETWAPQPEEPVTQETGW